MQVEMRWQKPDRDEYCYVQENGNIACHVRPWGNGQWIYRQIPMNSLGYCEHPEWRELGDRDVAYIPGPPPEGEQGGLTPLWAFWCESLDGCFRYATCAHDSMLWLNGEYYATSKVAEFLSNYRVIEGQRLPQWLQDAMKGTP